jgi:hypothetical protein
VNPRDVDFMGSAFGPSSAPLRFSTGFEIG